MRNRRFCRPTNAAPKALITRIAQRMLIENALSSAVGLKVDFDMALLVMASGLYRLLAQRMRGYADAQARQIFRDLINLPATITIADQEVEVSFHCRSHLPILLASGLLDQPLQVPLVEGIHRSSATQSGVAGSSPRSMVHGP